MKTLVFLIIALFLGAAVSAQTPQSFRYQAVARDNSGNVLAYQDVSFRISILSGSISGTEVYKETHDGLTTNAFGLVELEIGKGIPVTGTFSSIDWGINSYFVKIEMDPAGGTAYQELSTSQLLSVPYALYAQKAGNGFSGDYNDLFNKPLLFDGAWSSLTGKPTTLSGYGITDGMKISHPANGITSGMINNWNTAYSWGNHAGLYKPLSYQPLWTEIASVPAGFADGVDNVDDADNSITNEIQTLSITGNNLSLSKGGGTVEIPGDNWGVQTVKTNSTLTGQGTDATPLGVVNSTLTPSWSNIQSIPSGFADGTDNVDDADNSINNEIQSLSISGNNLTLSNGGGAVAIPGDNWGSQSVSVNSTLTGNGTAVTPLGIADNGVNSIKIVDNAIATSDLADNAVTSVKIQDGTIETTDLGGLVVTSEKLSASAVTTDKLNAGSVTGIKIAQAGATSGQVLKWDGTTWSPANDETGSGSTTPTGPAGGDLTGTYPNPVIGDGKVNSLKILDGSVTTADLADNSVVTPKLADNSVITPKLADNSVITSKIADHAVEISKLPPGAAPDNYLKGDGTWAIPSVGSYIETDPTWHGVSDETGDIGRLGDVGIGTVSPTALLHTYGTGTGQGNVVFEGSYKTNFPGKPPVSGAGTRMMWFPDKAAFRVGGVSDMRWDDAYIGSFSNAMGYNAIALGDVSLALGSYCAASNTCSVAIGYCAVSSGAFATAFGDNTTASGYGSTAIGNHTVTASYLSTAMGRYNVGGGTANSWVSTDPLFEIGCGSSTISTSNALTILKNGNTGIGTATPAYKLDVNGIVNLNNGVTSGVALRCNGDEVLWGNGTYFSWGYGIGYNYFANPVSIGSSATPAYKLYVNGEAAKSSGTSAWIISSDLRLKNLQGNYTKGLAEILTLQPVRFVYKADNPRGLPSDTEQVGFIAQDVQKIFPEAVNEANDGYLDFNMHAINVSMVNAIRELNEKVKTLDASETLQIQVIEQNKLIREIIAENDLLKERIEKLEKMMVELIQK